MEHDASIPASPDNYKYQRQIQQAEKKIASLERQCYKSKQQERAYYEEVLVYHKQAAKLDHALQLANRKISNLLVLIQDVEKQNKTLKTDYLEACKKVCELEVRNRCITERENYFENHVESANRSLKLMEQDYHIALRKVGEFEQSRELTEKKRREAVGQLYELQAKNAELEAALQFFKRRKCCLCSGKESEFQSKEELMECDRELTGGSTDSQLLVLKREKDRALEQLHHAEKEVLESERRNSELRQQVAELTLTITERDHQIRQCKQLFEATRRNYQDEVCKLEGSIFHWQTKYEQSLMELERESVDNGRRKDHEKDHEACWECDMKLRACQNDVAERDITIAYLQKLKNSHEDKIRQILNQYQEDISNDKISPYDSTLPDLHNQLQILLAFYKKRSDNATAELGKWKELAVEARLCREKETALFESQLSLISKEYYAKYEICRESFEKEKARRIALEGQTHRLARQLDECQNEIQSYRQELEDLKTHHESLTTENNNIITVTQQQKACRSACCKQEFAVPMDDTVDNPPESPTSEETNEPDSSSALKHENAEGERDSQDIVEISEPIEDAVSDKAEFENQTEPVVTNNHMESRSNDMVNGSTDSKEVFVDDESLNMEIENLRAKNAELQALCERLVRERDERTAGTTTDADQQSNDLASQCESHENEIQKLKRDLEEASLKQVVLEKSNSDLKAENQRLESLVQELQARIQVLESVKQTAEDSNTMTTETKDSAEVAEAKIDSVQDVEDALNESFAAQDLQSSPPEVPDGVKPSGEVVNDEVIMEEPSEIAAEKKTSSPHGSLARSKFPSAASTAPIPFKRHSHAGIGHRTGRPRTGSTEIGTAADRRASFGSDTSDTVPVDEEGKPKFPPKKFSTSHLDAFKPKPFKKQTSLSDDIHLYSRPLVSPKAGSTASDTESHEIRQEHQHSEADPSPALTASTSPKQPPATLPKPRKPHPDKAAEHIQQQQPAEDTSLGELV